MEIIYKSPDEIIPYERNPRHNDAAVKYVAESIREFGFQVPIVIDSNGVIVAGHTRHKAAKQLGLDKVPCTIAEGLTEAQIRAFRVADNKVAEKATWDLDVLQFEIDELEDFDLFGFDIQGDIEKHEASQEHTQDMVENILNLGKGQFQANNFFDMPELDPVYDLPEIKEWIGFNYVLSDKNPEGKAVHFFIDDYQFERIWNHPEKYLEKLKQYVCVATPDFSPYGDMPLICQLYNHYRKHWVGRWLQEHGVTVVPTIRSSTDPRSLEWFLDGEPEGGAVIISSMWTSNYEEESRESYDLMYERLHPNRIFVYGKKYDWMRGNITEVKNFTSKMWSKDG